MSERLPIGLGALALGSLLLYMGSGSEIAALLLATVCHELGHVAALWVLGLQIRRFRVELRGLCIEYYGNTSAAGHAAAAAAGPAAGLCWAALAIRLGSRLQLDWLTLSAGISLLLSLFNLLPALPLDGGRILHSLAAAAAGERRGERMTEACSLGVGALLLTLGIWLMLRGHGVGVLAAAIWLLLYQEDGRGLVKRTEMI